MYSRTSRFGCLINVLRLPLTELTDCLSKLKPKYLCNQLQYIYLKFQPGLTGLDFV